MAVGEDTCSRILDAAIEMMDSGGEASIRVAVIAKKLDIAEPFIYHHFTNRAALVEAAYVEWYWRLFENTSSYGDRHGTGGYSGRIRSRHH